MALHANGDDGMGSPTPQEDYNFDAPMHFDFVAGVDDHEADVWFDINRQSDIFRGEAEPLLELEDDDDDADDGGFDDAAFGGGGEATTGNNAAEAFFAAEEAAFEAEEEEAAAVAAVPEEAEAEAETEVGEEVVYGADAGAETVATPEVVVYETVVDVVQPEIAPDSPAAAPVEAAEPRQAPSTPTSIPVPQTTAPTSARKHMTPLKKSNLRGAARVRRTPIKAADQETSDMIAAVAIPEPIAEEEPPVAVEEEAEQEGNHDSIDEVDEMVSPVAFSLGSDSPATPAEAPAPVAEAVVEPAPKQNLTEAIPRARGAVRSKTARRAGQRSAPRKPSMRSAPASQSKVPRWAAPTASSAAAARTKKASANGSSSGNTSNHSKRIRKQRAKRRPRPQTANGTTPRWARPTEASRVRSKQSDKADKRPSTAPAQQRRRRKPRSTQAAPDLTVPVTPSFMRRQKRASKTKEDQMTSEEREMARINAERKALARVKARNKRALESLYQTDVVSTTYMPSRSSKPLTEPHEFRFRTDGRVRASTKKSDAPRRQNRRRRKHRQPAGGLTETQPFSFATDARIRDVHATEAYVSMAESVVKYATKTPDRFRRSGANGAAPAAAASPADHAAAKVAPLTVPVTPHFSTDNRAGRRPVDTRTTEDKVVEEIQAHEPFKARPVNRRVLESAGQLGVPKVPKAKPTEPLELSFASDARMERRREQVMAEVAAAEPSHEFHAHPVPKSIYNSPVVPKRIAASKKAPTVPQAPVLATDMRASFRANTSVVIEEAAPPTFKAQPLPDYGELAQIGVSRSVTHKAPTRPAPFALKSDERGSAYAERKAREKADREQAEQAAHMFRANPLPDLDQPDMLPAVPVMPVTEPEPFQLESVRRAAEAEARFRAKIEEELFEEQMQFSSFRAAEPKMVAQPFIPHKSTKPLTEIQEFSLNADQRAADRASYEAEKAARAAESERLRRQREEAERAQEAEELKAMRRSLVHRPEPVIVGAPIVIHASAKPLTEPQSPRFATASRLRNSRLI